MMSVTYLEVTRDDGVSCAVSTNNRVHILSDGTIKILGYKDKEPTIENFIVPQPQTIVENPSAIEFESILQKYLGNLPKPKPNPKPIGGGGSVKRKYTPRSKTITGGGVGVKRKTYNPEYQKRYRDSHREELNEKARERYQKQKRARTQPPSELVDEEIVTI